MRIAEKTLLILLLLCLWGKSSMSGGAEVMMLPALLLPGLLYLFGGFLLFHDIRLRDVFKREAYSQCSLFSIVMSVVTGMTTLVACVGGLFKLQFWLGGGAILLLAALLSAIVFIVLILLKPADRMFTRTVLWRTGVAGVVSLVLFATPSSALVRVIYFRYPAYATALCYAVEHPDDRQAWTNVHEERRKAVAH